MKFSEIIDKIVVTDDGFKLGKVKDIFIDTEEELKVTHLEIELTKDATEAILGVKPAFNNLPRNTLAISALKKGIACCSESGLELKVSKAQIAIYLRPT